MVDCRIRSESMAKYVKKPVEVEAITFEEFIRIGAENADSVVNGMPVKFTYNDYVIRQYNRNSYIIPTLDGGFLITKDDMLITGVNGEIYPCKKEIFEKTYEKCIEKSIV
jgi:hypothetical protein